MKNTWQQHLAYVPWALPLLVNEIPITNYKDALRRLKDLLPDLRVQSEAYLSAVHSRPSAEPSPTTFSVHLHGGMDTFAGHGACPGFACRVSQAERIVRSMGVIADQVWFTDSFTFRFIDFGRVTNNKLDFLLADVFALKIMWPMIEAGIFRFRHPWFAACANCAKKFDEQVALASNSLVPLFCDQFSLELDGKKGFTIETGDIFSPPTNINGRLFRGRAPSLNKYIHQVIDEEVRSALRAASEASLGGGAVFSNSKIGIAGLLELEKSGQELGQAMELFERGHSLDIPWVTNLNAAQVIQLRQEAANALPRFREMLAKNLHVTNMDFLDGDFDRDFISELREQAAEVRGELDATRKHSARLWKTSFGLLGLGLSAYGVISGNMASAVTGLLPILQLLIAHETGQEKEEAKLQGKPGYVLVKAQDILAHAH